MQQQEAPIGELSPDSIRQGLSVSSTYYDFDTKMREPKIESTTEAWGSGQLGSDSRYCRRASESTEVEEAAV